MASYAGELVHAKGWKKRHAHTVTCNVFPFVDGTIGKFKMNGVVRYCQWNEENRYWEQLMLDGQQKDRDELDKAYKEQCNL